MFGSWMRCVGITWTHFNRWWCDKWSKI